MVAVNNPAQFRLLPCNLKHIGKALLYRSDIADAILSSEKLKEEIIQRMLQQVNDECKHLCSLKLNSVLRSTKPKSLGEFNMLTLMSEWEKEAPLFFKFLLTSIGPFDTRDDIAYPAAMAGSILLKTRNIHMSALQHLTGLLLFHGNATKQVYYMIFNHALSCVTICK